MELERHAATMIRQALMTGGTLEGIARELGKMAVLYPIECLPQSDPIFNAQTGLEMLNAYNEGILYIQRMDLTIPNKVV
jgi:hypothetical protein